jgi:hypothetical protein
MAPDISRAPIDRHGRSRSDSCAKVKRRSLRHPLAVAARLASEVPARGDPGTGQGHPVDEHRPTHPQGEPGGVGHGEGPVLS